MKNMLITGAASGIGRASSLRMARAGWRVHAADLNPDFGPGLLDELGDAPGEIVPLTLDVTDDAQIAGLDALLPADLHGVVNNAGIAVDGPVESLTREQLHRQFDVNLISHVQVTRAVLERIRNSDGRIVFTSSISGRIATPWTAAYNASKYALECTADVLRLELRPWKIPVSLIEPTVTKTAMWDNAEAQFDAGVAELEPRYQQLYAKHITGLRRSMRVMHKTAAPVERVAAKVEHALTARRPRRRYPVGIVAQAQVVGAAIAPPPLLELVLAKGSGIPRKP